jgi:alpha-L-fucosidase
MLDVLEVAQICVKYKIKFEQYCFLMLRNYAPEGRPFSNECRKALVEYIENVSGFRREDLQDLEKRGFLDNFNENGEEMLTKYFVPHKISDKLWVEHEIAGQELWDTYPSFFVIGGGQKVPAKSCDREVLIESYCKKIKHSKKKHEEVLEVLKHAVQMNDIGMGIEKWVGSHQWESLKEKYYQGKSEKNGEQEFI